MRFFYTRRIFLFIAILSGVFYAESAGAQCGPGTPSFTANLVGSPTGTWTSPSIQRNDTCCGATAPDQCLKFTIILDPNAVGINFDISSGAIPPGALYYQINCGPLIPVGSPICLSGPGPHILTFCKPGNNTNTYAITSIPAPSVPDSILIRSGCSGTLAVSGFSVPTLNWTSVNPGPNGFYNSYLNCTSGCATVIATPTGTPPPYVDYEVSGYAASPCQANFYRDTVRVYFYSDLSATITPINPTICYGNNSVVLTATATGGLPAYTYSWSTGSTTQTVSVGPGTYTVFVYDRTGCPPTYTTCVVSQFTLPITANAGPDLTLCKSSPQAVLNGTITSASGGVWSGGSGTISPSTTALTITYTPTGAELTAGSVQLFLNTTGNSGCPPGADTVVIHFQNASLANAGPDFTVCSNNSTVNLSGSVTGYTNTGQWSTSGSGSFGSTTNLNTTYTPGAGDISSGSVYIILSSTNNGACPASSDSLKVTITPSPTVNAGPDQSVCSTSVVALSGTVTGASSTGSWSTTGNGSFNPSASALNANYILGSNDISSGSVTLILTSTNNGGCLAARDTLKVTITKIAVVNAGPDQMICSTNSSVALTGTVSGGTTSGIWSTSGSGGFNPGNSIPVTGYNLSVTDISSGLVTMTLTSTGNGACPAISDTMSIRIIRTATVNAGPNQALCSSTGSIGLSGIINSTAGSGIWTATGSGTYNPGASALTTSYFLTPADIAAGAVIFTLTSTNNGPCPVGNDTVKVSITTLAVVNAGPDQLICSSNGNVALTGTVSSGTSSGTWSTSGSGAFNPGNAFPVTGYNLSVTDANIGLVTMTLTSTGNGVCPAVSDSMSITIVKMASVYAGPNQVLCSTTGSVGLAGNITSTAGSGIWTATGSGTYNPGASALNTSYFLTPSDIANGVVTFSLTSTNNGPCLAAVDTVKVRIIKTAIVNAGPDYTICSTPGQAVISGSVSGGTSVGIWSTSGTGVFTPGNTFLSCGYNASAADIASGSVFLILTSANNGVCPAVKDTSKLTIIAFPVIKLTSDTSVCANQNPFTVKASVSGGSGVSVWSTSGSGTFDPSQYFNPVQYHMSNSDISAGLITLSITAINNGPCGNLSASIHVTIHPDPQANFSASSYTVYIPNNPITFNNLSSGATSYSWSFGDGSTTNITSPVHNYSSVGYYTVGLIATNQYHCTDTVDQVVTVISDIQFPTAFTPNPEHANGGSYSVADLSNDVFFPYTSGVTNYHLMIFNRWGELIFESHELDRGWDGYFGGKLCQQDAYVWKADVKFFDGRNYNKTGSVTLLR